MRIAGQRKGETYPEVPRATAASGGGFFVRGGSDNSIADVSYLTGTTGPLLVEPDGAALSVPLTGFTPGNMIVVMLSITMINSFASGPVDFTGTFIPKIDIGAGARAIFLNFAGGPRYQTPINVAQTGTLSWQVAIVPVTVEVTADPVVTCDAGSNGSDGFYGLGYGVILSAYEADISKVTKVPTTYLIP